MMRQINRERLRAALAPNQHGAQMRWIWFVLVVTTTGLLWRYPDQGWVMLSKLNRVALGAILGVGLDRLVFHYARPTAERADDAWQYRRVALMVGGMMAAALAL